MLSGHISHQRLAGLDAMTNVNALVGDDSVEWGGQPGVCEIKFRLFERRTSLLHNGTVVARIIEALLAALGLLSCGRTGIIFGIRKSGRCRGVIVDASAQGRACLRYFMLGQC